MESYREKFSQHEAKFRAESHFLHVVAPSVVRPGEPFALQAVMMDATGMPAEDYRGTVRLEPSEPALRAPDALEFGPGDLGRVVCQGLVAEQEGGYYVVAEPQDTPGAAPRSTPILASAEAPPLWWGDIHVHTTVGHCHPDKCKGPEFGYWYGREAALLDFCSATDHLRGIHREEGNWRRLVEAARTYHRPGQYVTLLGFESSHATGYGGDNNIYYDAAEADYFWLDRDDMRGTQPKVSLEELWQWLEQQGVPYLSVPHHTARAAKYRDFGEPWHNPERETVLEVYSWWGSSEGRHDDLYLKGGKADAPAYWTDALELGYRYGVIGSSDTHHTMPGTPYPVNAENYWYAQHRLNCQGLAAVYADRLERGSIFDSLLGRRCYGTTWWRPVIRFGVSGHRMGDVAESVPETGRRRVAEAVVASSHPGRLELLRNNTPIASERVSDGLTEFTYVDEQPLEDVCVRGAAKSPAPFAFYYLKLTGNNGQIAWSSPVWIVLG